MDVFSKASPREASVAGKHGNWDKSVECIQKIRSVLPRRPSDLHQQLKLDQRHS